MKNSLFIKKSIIKLVIIFLFKSCSPAFAGTTKFSIGASHSFEDHKQFEIEDKSLKDDLKTVNFSVTYFLKNGINFSAGTNRLINHRTRKTAALNGKEFLYKEQIFIDNFAIGYKINRVNTSLAIANVKVENSFGKKSEIVPAINVSYFLSRFSVANHEINVVPSLTFYRAKELDITKGVLLNINLMF